MESAEQKNEYAAHHQLGKLYLAGEDIPKDVDIAIRWLTEAADQNNQYAQYLLGKLYLCGRDVLRDREKAILFLQASAAQEDEAFLQFSRPSGLVFGDPSAFLAATRLLHRLENLFRVTIRKQLAGSPFHIDRSAGVSWRRRNRRRTQTMTENPFNRLFDRR